MPSFTSNPSVPAGPQTGYGLPGQLPYQGGFSTVGGAQVPGWAGLAQQQMLNYQGLNANVQPNQLLQNAQMAALQQYGTLAQSGGYTPQFMAQNALAQQQNNMAQQGQQGAVFNQAQQQGNAGPAQAMASRLSAGQGAANGSALAANQMAANARTNTLNALNSYSQLAGNINSNQFNQANANYQNAVNVANAKNNLLTSDQNTSINNQNTQLGNFAGGLKTIASFL